MRVVNLGTLANKYSSCDNCELFHNQTSLFQMVIKRVLLGAFTKLRKTTISFVMPVRSSVCPHGTTLLPFDEFLRYLIFEYFSMHCPEN